MLARPLQQSIKETPVQKLRSILVSVLALILTVQPALGWSEGGHHLIAVLAYDLMQPAQQKRLMELLENHPRFAGDFKPGPKVADLNHWTIGRAGYWPDVATCGHMWPHVARDQPAFNRPNWHYQLGSTLTIGDNVKVHATPGALPTGATLETKNLHIGQAIELCRQTLRGPGADSDNAIAIYWLAHLVADSHQPCHAGSLYVDGIFAPQIVPHNASATISISK